MQPVVDLFIAGTDTGVGKSLVSLMIMQLLFQKGYRPFYLKPFQTGCADPQATDSDAKFIYDHTPALKGRDPAQSVAYCFPAPRAPYFAARNAGGRIDLSAVQNIVASKREQYAPLVVEGAGGLLVPVTRQALMVDVVKLLGCRPLLVARAGLGTINHTLLSIEALRSRHMKPVGVVFVDAAEPPADPVLVAENIRAVEMFGQVPVSGVIDYIPEGHTPPPSAYGILEKMLW